MNILPRFSHSQKGWWGRRSKFTRVLVYVLTFIIVIAALLMLWAVANVNAARTIYDESLAAKQSLEYAQVAVANQNFELAQKDLAEAEEHFANAKAGLDRFRVYKFVPYVSKQIGAAESMLLAGQNLSDGLEGLAVLGMDITEALDQGDDVSFGSLTSENKRIILQTLAESPAELQGVKTSIELAVLHIEEIPDDGLLSQLKQVAQPVKQQLPLLQSLIDQFLPMAQTIPTIAGYPDEKTYLFLLQNNRELRPTGGFIGTYGIIRLKDGEIQEFSTENIYVLDEAAKDKITTPSPEPIAVHTTTQNWLMRNINWSPHFPEVGIVAQERYAEEVQYLEGDYVSDVDGVIAVTPSLIEDLLELVGPQSVGGFEFTSKNLFDTLEYETQYGYNQKGVDDFDRKDIIGLLADELMDELFALPQSRFTELWNVYVENVEEKHVLIYVDDPITQALVVEQNWAGEMKDYNSDFLMFVDANLAALKTDKMMERTVNYTVSKEGNDYYGTAEMVYNHTGWFDGFTTRYRTHTRIYVPQGAELVEHSGFMTNDKTRGGVPTDPAVSDVTFDNTDGSSTSYTVVEGFTSIEPGTTGTLKIKYKLPQSVIASIEAGEYELYAQKQAGTREHGLNVNFDIGKRIDFVSPQEGMTVEGNSMKYENTLLTDREISVKL